MLLRKINDLVLDKIPSIDKTVDSLRERSTDYVNFAIDEVWRASNWEFRKRTGQLALEPTYDTGTASITKYDGTNLNAARTVTLSASLPFDVRGRYFKPNNSSSNYRIITGASGGTTLFLESPVIDSTNGSIAFDIWKRFYYLKSDVDVLLDIRRWDGGGSLEYSPSPKMSRSNANLDTEGAPKYFSVYGIDPNDDIEYETGTISIAENSNTVTGVSTAFVGNADSGDILIVNNSRYIIKRVESNTSLILYNYVPIPIAAGTSYSIKKNNPLAIPFFNPTDAYRTLDYEYLVKSYSLVNEDYDDLLLDMDYIDAIILNAQAAWLEHKDYQKYIQIYSLYQAKLNGLKIKKRVVAPRFRQFEPYINPNLPGRD